MRGLLAIVCLGGCSYSPSPATAHDAAIDTRMTGDGTSGDAAVDAGPDAPSIDASTSCLASATATSPAGHHYFLTSDLIWTAAQATCASVGGHLVKIEDATENTFITTQFALGSGTFAWIGLSDPTSTNVYVWTDLTPLLGFNAFSGGTPPASSSDCVDSDGTWDAFGCGSSNHGGVCECE